MLRIYKNKNQSFFIIASIVIVLSACNYWYGGDTNSNVRHGMMFWEALFSGRFLNFYDICTEGERNGLTWHPAVYSILIYFVIAIWNFPLYIIEKITECNDILIYTAARIYSKMQLVVALVFLAKLCNRVFYKWTQSEIIGKWSGDMLITSLFAICSVGLCGQVDVISVILLILAMDALFEEKKSFWIWYILAIQFKTIAIFFFVPVIFLKYKNIYKIVIGCSLPILIQYIIMFPFSLASDYVLKDRNISGLEEIFSSEISLMFGKKINVYIFLWAILLIYLFLNKRSFKTQTEMMLYYFWAGQVSLGLFFLFSGLNYYWLIYMVPGNVLLVLSENDYEMRKRFLALETISGIGITIAFMYHQTWLFDLWLMDGMLFDIIIPLKKFSIIGIQTICEWIMENELVSIVNVLSTSLPIWLVVVVWYLKPFRGKTEEMFDDEHEWRRLLFFRGGVNFFVANCATVLFIIGILKSIIEKVL